MAVLAQASDVRMNVQKMVAFGIIVVGALLFGSLLGSSYYIATILVVGIAALMLLPYHSMISACLAMATFNSALLLPFFPGRPYIWEFAGLLGWSGLVITISLRAYAPDAWKTVMDYKWIFVGIIGYCMVLLVTMYFRGVGLRILGSSQMGGRFYFQQLVCAIFPLTFLLLRLREDTLVKLFQWQCLLTATYLVSDFVYSRAPQGLFFILRFFEVPNDAFNFENQAMRFGGIRRFQSLAIFAQGLILWFLVRHRLKDFLTLSKGSYLTPMVVLIFGIGLLSGHRYMVVVLGMTVIVVAYAQKFYDFKTTFVFGSLLCIGLVVGYGAADKLPLAAQRAISFLPGIKVQSSASMDARATFHTRALLREQGMKLIPEYFWLGRGFGLSSSADYSNRWDPTSVTAHINQGTFYNGFIGLMINTGFPGTLFMFIFIGYGSLITLRMIGILRKIGCDDMFLRMCTISCGLWIANTVGFIFLHGDSEFAMKSFALQTGIQLTAHYHLKNRYEAWRNPAPDEEEGEDEAEEKAPAPRRLMMPSLN
jgi:hypothetical protein